MHGIVFQQLQQFVTKSYGHETWAKVIADAGQAGKLFLPNKIYPDSDATSIVQAACKALNAEPAAVLEAFGEFIAPNLLKIYAASIKPEWKVLDLLQHTEEKMHRAVRFSDHKATPPALGCTRVSQDKVRIEYSSERNMIDLGIGIIKGFGKFYDENLSVRRFDQPNSTVLEIVKVH
jgi:hypothetical protein